MTYDPAYPTSVPIWRQAEVLKITDEQALEGFLTFIRTNEKLAEKYPDYVRARRACSHTLNRLAAMAVKVDEAWVETCLSTMEDKAQEIADRRQQEREQGRAA